MTLATISKIELSDLLTGVAILISILASYSAHFYARKSIKDSKKANQIAEKAQLKANIIAESSNTLQALDWTSQYFESVRSWASEASYCISKLIHLSLIKDDRLRMEIWFSNRSKLSALIDTGRWYFPNSFEKEFGTDKPIAYRGIRQEVLEILVRAYNAQPYLPKFYNSQAQKNDLDTQEAYDTLVKCQRNFVSEIQSKFDPKDREKTVNLVLNQFELMHKMRDPEKGNSKNSSH